MKITVKLPNGSSQDIDGKDGWTLMEAIRDAGVAVVAACGGGCACATCHVHVDGDWAAKLPEADEEEVELLADSDTYDAAVSRLSCQVELSDAMDGLTVSLQEDAFDG